MKYAGFKYCLSDNLGDQIQSLAAEQFLPSVNKRFDRDSLNQVSETEKYLLIMNGWFSESPKNWPPSESIMPVYIGFHITEHYNTRHYFLNNKSIEHLKQYEPIGCRDKKTAQLLSEKGVKNYYSKCLSLSFPKRKSEPKNGKVFLVDVTHIFIPKNIRREAIKITHSVPRYYDNTIKLLMAKKLLEMYRTEARLIITSRLHCALPCIAMGIPVIFFGNPDDSRLNILEDIHLKTYIYKMPKSRILRILKKRIFKFFPRKVNWNPDPISIESEKSKLIKRARNTIESCIRNKALNKEF